MYRRAKILILLGLMALEMTACGTENAEDVKKLMDTESEYLLS